MQGQGQGQGSMRPQLPPRSPQVIHPVGQHNQSPMGQQYGTPTRHRSVSLPPMMQQQQQVSIFTLAFVLPLAFMSPHFYVTSFVLPFACRLPLSFKLTLSSILAVSHTPLDNFNPPSTRLLQSTLSQANQQSPHYQQQGQQQPYYHNNNMNNSYQTGLSDNNSMGQRVESPIGSEFR